MDKKIKVAVIFGTRPEAIKMCPLVLELKKYKEFEPVTIVTAQHRQMLDQVLELFEITPDYDLNLMKPNQNLWSLTSDILLGTKEIFEKVKPDIVLIHGDTTTAFASALSAFYARIPIGHVEAGLRTFNKDYPFPEEINRVLADSVSDLHFAPTEGSVQNLLNSGIKEGISDGALDSAYENGRRIYKTGNTVIDALLYTVKKDIDISFIGLNPNLKTILLTSHRRENFGKPLENICDSILELVQKNKDIEIVYPVHLNPNVRNTVFSKLQGVDRVKLIDPLDYAPFCALMKKAHIILTDSGGVQEEAPSLGIPVLVLRDETERPEAVDCGCVKLVGTNKEKIVSTVQKLLDDSNFYNSMKMAVNPYGDGLASKRIADIIKGKFTV
ncbi:MAG: UDP-N-acetylglucosamine 2-epimerase (non-hydrolyzing) [Candidatus Gastranaerophilales bacterium]|nr:UDP-N-acetylglucosamine 2-epimerase (non-hydrolyzing) [Candidatus Gastranaerophilales bacterium]